MKDFLNNDINVGDTIVYPGRQGSSLWMNKAKVIGIEMEHRPSWSYHYVPTLLVQRDNGKVYKVYCTERVVVIPEFLELPLAMIPTPPSTWMKIKAKFIKIWNWKPIDEFSVQDY